MVTATRHRRGRLQSAVFLALLSTALNLLAVLQSKPQVEHVTAEDQTAAFVRARGARDASGKPTAAAVAAAGLMVSAAPGVAAVADADIAITAADSSVWLMPVALLLYYAPGVLSMYSRETGPIQQAASISYCVNRGQRNFDEAIFALAARFPGHGAGEVFTYFDTFGGHALPTLRSFDRIVQLIDREVTGEYDDKLALTRLLQRAGGEEAFAQSFETWEKAFETTSGDPGALFFLKHPDQSGGAGMRVLRRAELPALGADVQQMPGAEEEEQQQQQRERPISSSASGGAFNGGNFGGRRLVLQQAVQDLELIDGRKFVIRFYFLVHDGELHLHRRGIVVVHGAPYDRASVDYRVQIQHDWHDPKARARLETLQSSPRAERWHSAIAQGLRLAAPALQSLLAASSTDRFTLVGGDALIEESGEARFIELNMYPNIYTSDIVIDKEVNQPVLRDLVAKVLMGASPPEFERIEMFATVEAEAEDREVSSTFH